MPWLGPIFVALLGVTVQVGAQISFFVISTAASLVIGQVSKLLTKKPTSASSPLSSNSSNRTLSARQAVSPRHVAYGYGRMGGIITFMATSGANNEFVQLVITITGHQVDSIPNMYFDGVLVPLDGSGNATGTFAGLVHAEFNYGSRTQAAFPGLVGIGGWTSAHRQRGCAGVYVRLKWDQNKFPNGIPNITFDVRGRNLVYDPRSGTLGYSTNAALNVADYLNNAVFGLCSQTRYGLTGSQLTGSGLGSFSAAFSVDGDVTDVAWNTDAAVSGATCSIDLGAGVAAEFRRFRIYMSASGYTGSYDIQVSDNNSTWGTVASGFVPDVVGWNDVELPSSPHRYFRLRLTNTPGAGPNIREIEFWSSDIDSAALITAANTCDEQVVLLTNTTIAASITLNASPQAVTPASMLDIVPGVILTIDTGGNTEFVTVTAVTAATFLGIFTKNHTGPGIVVTGNEPRFTCNGSFTTDAKPADIIGQMNTALAGSVVYISGKWGIYPGTWRGSSLNLGDADLRAPITVQTRRTHRDIFNGVKGTFLSPQNFWQMSDFPPYLDQSYVYEDANEQLWSDVEYPFTISAATAQRISKINLRRIRHQISFTGQFNLKAYQVQPMDIVQFSHARFGWTNKLFEVASCSLIYANDASGQAEAVGVDLALNEVDSTIYDWSTADENSVNVPPTTILPTNAAVAAPTSLALASAEVARAADGVKTAVIVATWTAPADQFVINGGAIVVQFKKHTDTNWITNAKLDGASVTDVIGPVVDGVQYDVQMWAENISAVKSAIVSSTIIPSATQLLIDTIGDGSSFYRPRQGITLPTDLPYNASFEIFPDGAAVADGWTKDFVEAGGTYARSNVPFAGNYAQSITCTASVGGSIASKPFGVTPGLQYNVRFRVIASAANVGLLYATVTWYSNDSDLSSGGALSHTDFVGGVTSNAASFTLWESQVTAPAGAKFARIKLSNGATASPGTLSFDTVGWALYQVITATPAAGTTNAPSTTSNVYATVPEMTQTITTTGGKVLLLFSSQILVPATTGYFSFFVDGARIGPEVAAQNTLAVSISHVDSPAAGSHTYTVKWKNTDNVTQIWCITTQREMQVVQIA